MLRAKGIRQNSTKDRQEIVKDNRKFLLIMTVAIFVILFMYSSGYLDQGYDSRGYGKRGSYGKSATHNPKTHQQTEDQEEEDKTLETTLDRRKKFHTWKPKLANDKRIRKMNAPPKQVINYEKTHGAHGRDAPGEMGRPTLTSPAGAAFEAAGWKEAGFNQFISDKISVNRRLPDVRHPSCLLNRYSYTQLPKTSVIICFTEESWSTLLRTVHSIINRTPPELLEEIILVDDYSQRDHLQGHMEDYMGRLPKIKLIRLPRREGLVRARLAGVTASVSPVLTFLDSHVEVTVGWLEPMLERVWRERTAVVCPVVDDINRDHFGYGRRHDYERGSFQWDLSFVWEHHVGYSYAPNFTEWKHFMEYAGKENLPHIDIIRTPVMSGGLFTIDKNFFKELGLYDPGLEVWGSENMELSFKAWMCGGSVEIATCSHVGHVFRNQSAPYTFPDSELIVRRNAARVAYVWMDEYKELFYQNTINTRKLQADRFLEGRKEIRYNLECKSFAWYLHHVAPELYAPSLDVQAKGQLMNAGTLHCLDKKRNGDGRIIMHPCHGEGPQQYFRLSRGGVLEVGQECVSADEGVLLAVDCRGKHVLRFSHQPNGHLKEKMSGRCVEVVKPQDGGQFYRAELMECGSSPIQRWRFKEYYDKDGMLVFSLDRDEL